MSSKYVNKVSYTSYSTIYEASGDINIKLSEYACFAHVLNRGNIHNEEYNIYLIRDPKYAIEHHMANLCFLSLQQLRKHIGLVRRLFPFEYTVTESEYSEYPAYKVNIKMNANHFYHRYLLTWIRYAYEFPFNVILMDAIRMKHCYLNRESIANMFVLCANSYSGGPGYYNTGHSISFPNSKFSKEYELKENIKRIAEQNSPTSRVNNLYGICGIPNYPRFDSYDGNNKYLEFWTDPEGFEKRAKTYLQGYKLMKQKK